jgi:hypothetical protein
MGEGMAGKQAGIAEGMAGKQAGIAEGMGEAGDRGGDRQERPVVVFKENQETARKNSEKSQQLTRR